MCGCYACSTGALFIILPPLPANMWAACQPPPRASASVHGGTVMPPIPAMFGHRRRPCPRESHGVSWTSSGRKQALSIEPESDLGNMLLPIFVFRSIPKISVFDESAMSGFPLLGTS
jgi:hypothetical protein